MKNLKLNQLNKQKINEREMNLIEGGAYPLCHGPMQHVEAEIENPGAVSSCTSHCTDSQYWPHCPSHDNMGGAWSVSLD
jgi:natural product precursor